MRRRPSASAVEEEDDNNNSTDVTADNDNSDLRETRPYRDVSPAHPDVKTLMIEPAGPRLSGSHDHSHEEQPRADALSKSTNAWPTKPAAESSREKSAGAMRRLGQDITAESSMPESRTWRRRARSRSPWTCSPLILSTTVLAVLLVFAIAQSFVKRQLDPKGCRMSMMRPAFAKLVDFDTEHTRFASKYSLYLYREGGIDEDTMVKGVPVLFIPGNAGSYKQVRPLGAEAAQYFHDVVQHDTEAAGRGTRSLDFFTVDFNEDFTAFHGQTLLDQAEYLNEAVAYILSLYHDPRHSARDSSLPDPSSVILVGHSMGGIVARTMLIMPNYQANSINTIITMSTPHARPPVSFDAELVQTYTKINKYWRQAYSQKWANNNPLWHVTLISIAGGGLDTVVPSDYTSLSSLVPDTHGFTVFTSSVPDVWTGMDHLAILWCDQFRKIIVRALIEVVDARRASQTKPRAERMRVFKKWFLTGMESVAERTLPQKEPTTLLTLEDNSNSIISQGQRLSLRQLGSAGRPRAYLMPVPPQETPGGKRFTLLSDQKLDAPGENGKLEVLFCSVFPLHPGQSATLFSMNMDLSGDSSGSTRLACKNAAADTIHLPASTRLSQFAFEPTAPFSYLQYELEDLAEHQFVAIVDKAANPTPGWVIAEFSDNVDSIHWMNQLTLRQFLTNGLQLSLATIRPMVTEIKIPVLQSSLLAYKLRIGTQSCGKGSELFTPLLRQYITDPFESKFFVNVQEANINLHGVAPYIPPPLKPRTSVDGLSLQLWSDPTCDSALDVSLQVDVLGSLGKLVMRYSTVFAAFPLFVVALVLRKQFKVYDERGIFISFSESLDQCLRGSLPVLFFGLYFIALSVSRSSPAQTNPASYGIMDWQKNGTESALDMTKNDLLMGSQDPFFWFLVPLTGLITVGACVLVNYAALALIHVFSTAYSLFVSASVRIKNDDRRRSSSPAFAAISPRRRVITTAILFLLVATFIPYQFAYMVACLVQIATCTRAFRVARETRSGSHLNFYNYAHSVLILMLWVLPINLPILVVWLHNLAVHWLTPFSSHHNVLSIMPLILLVETLTTGTMIPRVTTRFRYVTDGLLFLLAIYADVYGVSYAYFLHQLVNFVAAWLVAIHFSTSSFSLSALLHSLLEGSNINAPLSSSSGANGSGSGSGSAVGSSRSSASGLFSAAFFSSSSNNPAQPGSSSGSSSGGGGGAGSNRISNSSSSSSTSNVKKRP